MNRMRFGAVLAAADGRIGFYLSHRVVLTVPHSGVVRAVSFEQFGKCRVFARNGVAVSCFDAMMKAADTDAEFGNSLEMALFFLNLPEKSGFGFLCMHMNRSSIWVYSSHTFCDPSVEPSSTSMTSRFL